jgi:hypothetical protein
VIADSQLWQAESRACGAALDPENSINGYVVIDIPEVCRYLQRR